MLDKLTTENIAQWLRQIETPYSELFDKEKERDLSWFNKVLILLEHKV